MRRTGASCRRDGNSTCPPLPAPCTMAQFTDTLNNLGGVGDKVAQLNRGRVSAPAQAALSGSQNEAPGSAGGNLTCVSAQPDPLLVDHICHIQQKIIHLWRHLAPCSLLVGEIVDPVDERE